jgi:hypothetical protein
LTRPTDHFVAARRRMALRKPYDRSRVCKVGIVSSGHSVNFLGSVGHEDEIAADLEVGFDSGVLRNSSGASSTPFFLELWFHDLRKTSKPSLPQPARLNLRGCSVKSLCLPACGAQIGWAALPSYFSLGKTVVIVGLREQTHGEKTRRSAAFRSLPQAIRGSRTSLTSAAAANIELAINCGVLRTDVLDIAGVLRRNVTRTRLAVADWRAADQSRFVRQR